MNVPGFQSGMSSAANLASYHFHLSGNCIRSYSSRRRAAAGAAFYSGQEQSCSICGPCDHWHYCCRTVAVTDRICVESVALCKGISSPLERNQCRSTPKACWHSCAKDYRTTAGNGIGSYRYCSSSGSSSSSTSSMSSGFTDIGHGPKGDTAGVDGIVVLGFLDMGSMSVTS